MAEPLLAARGLVVSYGAGRGPFGRRRAGAPVVNGVDLAVARGETLGIVGESGSGKTTLGRALIGLVRPSAGTVTFDGVNISGLDEARLRPLRRRMQMIFQDPMASLNPRHRIGTILTGPLRLHGIAATRRAADDLAAATLDRVGLPQGVMGRYPHELSGGQRQRVGIARAVMLRPDFILADEIVSGLDVSTQAQVLRLIGDLTREMGLALAFISHDLSVIRAVCDRVLVLRRGLVAEEGRCDLVFAAPRSPYTRALIDAIPLPVPDPGWLDRPGGRTLSCRARRGPGHEQRSRAGETTMVKALKAGCAGVLALLGCVGAAGAQGLPGMRGHDHTGVTVPDMKQALGFFTEVLGCKAAMTFGPFSDDKGTFMSDVLHVNDKAVIEQITMVRCGAGSNIELFKYTAPDQKDMTPKNSDIGGMHIALYVDDVQAAKDYLVGKGVTTFKGPIAIGEGPAAGETILYFTAPWGLQFEAISYPKGMGYEKGASTVLWKPTEPAK